jgi:Raf kinase inhibitor-like YbhB/YbcL family protein
MRTVVLAALVLAFVARPLAGDVAGFVVTSPGLAEGDTAPQTMVFSGDGCTGANISPEIDWAGAPPGTRSFAVIMHDPDAPEAGGFWHWVLFDIPAGTTGLPKGAGDPASKLLPAGAVTGKNGFGERAYGGPCPPVGSGTHHYVIVVHALKVEKLADGAQESPAAIAAGVKAAELGEARLTLTLAR